MTGHLLDNHMSVLLITRILIVQEYNLDIPVGAAKDPQLWFFGELISLGARHIVHADPNLNTSIPIKELNHEIENYESVFQRSNSFKEFVERIEVNRFKAVLKDISLIVWGVESNGNGEILDISIKIHKAKG